jgi:hypothetical protein
VTRDSSLRNREDIRGTGRGKGVSPEETDHKLLEVSFVSGVMKSQPAQMVQEKD